MPNIGAILSKVESQSLRSNLPEFNVGDGVKMRIKVAEGDKVRVHPWEGTIIRKAGSGARATFTVRKISFGEGIERVFPVNSPTIESMEVVSRGIVKRSRLYYLRGQSGKKAKVERQAAA